MEITATIQCCRIMKALQLLKDTHKTCLYFHEPTDDFFSCKETLINKYNMFK